MKFILKKFEDLSTIELYDLLRLRAEVFVLEQNCPYIDLDGLDDKGYHLLGIQDEALHAYARILPPGVYFKETMVGRIVTSQSIRGKGLGKQIVVHGIEHSKKLFPSSGIRIMAQCYLLKFYEDLGFKAEGEEFLEDGIPHVEMLLHS